MIIKIDIDGVLRNILETICDIYNKDFCDVIEPKDVKIYDVDEAFPSIKEYYGYSAAYYFFERHSLEIFRFSPIYNGAKEAIDKLHEMGYKIVLVSYQKTLNNKIHTLEWLSDNYIQYDDICFTSNKDIIKGDIMIDDNPDFLYQISDSCQKVLIDMPYNRECKDFKRFKNLAEFVESLV